jgi:hypothetical protein
MTESQPNMRETIPLQEGSANNTESENNLNKVGLIIGVVVILGLLITGLIFLLQPGTDTARVRDIFIIFMALEFLLLGIVMIILIVQLARLTLLLQNEIKPILDSTSETANTLKGTTTFLSERLVEPVLKMNQYLAGLSKLADLFKSNKK